MKDENKQTIVLEDPIFFDYQLIDRITFDLVHINQGWDEDKHNYACYNRSSYTEIDIIDFFEQFKYFTVEWILGMNKESIKIKGSPFYRYHWETSDEIGNTVRVILDLPIKETGEGIIVTIFKV